MLFKSGRSGTCAGLAICIGILVGSQAKAQVHCALPNAKAANTGQAISADDAHLKNVIQGKVTNADTGEPIAGADVVLTGVLAQEKRRETHTRVDGTFVFEKLEPGQWLVTISSPGTFSKSQEITLTGFEQKTLEVALEDLEGSDILRVTGERTYIHPQNIGSSTHLNRDFLDKYKSGNSLRDVIESTPGVLPDSFGNIIVRGEHNALNYIVDDVVLPEAAGVLQQGQFASPRSLQSVDVEIGGYEAKDGGGPMGAMVRMRSLPIQSKPILQVGTQLGGPLAGGINFYGSGALSQNTNSIWNRIKAESSGAINATSLGVEPPVEHSRRNGRVDINILSKAEFQVSERDTLKLTLGINETLLHIPTSGTSRSYGVKVNQHDRQNFLILSYKHRFEKWLDEGNFHVLNGFYSQRLNSNNVFDPFPVVNGDMLLQSASPTASRLNYILSLQGDVSKNVHKTHHFLAGFLSEIRPVSTNYSAFYYNADLRVTANATAQASNAQQAAIANALNNGASPDAAAAAGAAAAAAVPQIPYGALISPFTGLPGGPQLLGDVGKYKGFRYLQSAYLQDSWKPTTGVLKRLTVDAGVRADVYYGVFGNTLKVAESIATIPGVSPFLLKPFQQNTVCNAQASGRFGASVVVTKNTVLRASFSQLFVPPPVDSLVRPFNATGPTFSGFFNGSLRPLEATRGYLIDSSIEQQLAGRFVQRFNLFYKRLKNVGDELPVDNTLLYQRLTLSGLETYGVEMRLDLKPNKEGYGLNGFVSNSVMVAKLMGNHKDSGGIYDVDPTPSTAKYIDHDRRETLQAGLGYKAHNRIWLQSYLSYWTGFLDGRDPATFGGHPARSRPITMIGLNIGYNLPAKFRKRRWLPTDVNVRIENLTNVVAPINLGSPFQGTRYTLPIRILSGAHWQV